MSIDLAADLDPGATLAGLEDAQRRRRAVELDDLLLVGRWCDLHSTDPRNDPRPDPSVPRPPGSDQLVRLGGAGTPGVRELSLCELGVARGVHTLAARAVAADILDLRHRLPRTWAVVRSGRADAWLARKVASMTRDLSLPAVALVDAATAAAIGSQSPSRVLGLVEAKIVEADTAAHDARVEAARRRRFVSLTRTDEVGLRHVIARVTAGDAAYVDAVVARVAELLSCRPEHRDAPRDLLRSIAFGWLARPAELLTLLLEGETLEPEPDEGTEPDPEPAQIQPPRALAFPADLLDALRKVDPARLRPQAVLYVHLHEAALGSPTSSTGAVTRVEGIGPHSLSQLAELLAQAHVAVKPVVDLRDRVSVNAYEHPTWIKERVHLARPGDAFPHATSLSRRLDVDHRTAYRAQGPPGQTGPHNAQPLGRTGHRAKTHLGYRVTALPTGETVWRTPHGLDRIVDERGTHLLAPGDYEALTGRDPLQRALVRLQHRLRTGGLG